MNSSESKNALILSSVRWNFLWQRHHSIAAELSSQGWNVIYVDPHPRGLRHLLTWLSTKLKLRHPDIPPDVPHCGVNVVPWYHFGASSRSQANRIRRHLCGESPELALLYLPSKRNQKILEQVAPKHLVYDQVLDWKNIPRTWFPPRAWKSVHSWIESLSQERRATVISDSIALSDIWIRKGVPARTLLPAVDPEFLDFDWARPCDKHEIRVIGYFGAVRSEEIDIDLLIALSERVNVHIVGPLDVTATQRLAASKIELSPPMSLMALTNEIDQWDAIVLPYRSGPRTETFVPAKIWNCIATNKPVLVSGLKLPGEIQALVEAIPDNLGEYPTVRQVSPNLRQSPILPTWTSRVSELLQSARLNEY